VRRVAILGKISAALLCYQFAPVEYGKSVFHLELKAGLQRQPICNTPIWKGLLMPKTHTTSYLLLLLLILSLLSACNGAGGSAGAPAAVEGYLGALVSKDENRVINLSCAAWEAQARQEYNSFAAVELKLEGLKCQQVGQEGDYTLVACSGVMIASYGAEDLEIDVAERNYQVIQESGEWRMCGYHE